MKELQEKCAHFLESQCFDSLALGIIDFGEASFESFQITPYGDESLFWDLASLTKPLTVGLAYLSGENLFDQSMKLLLNHRGGLPAWGRLSKIDWKEQITSYQIQESETIYSDFSALRLMIEIEKKTKQSLQDLCRPFWDEELLFWKDLPLNSFSPITGVRDSKEIMGEVHDDNAYRIGSFCSHAGLFSTIDGLCKTLLKIEKKLNLLNAIGRFWDDIPANQRFIQGWDRVQDRNTTLAGDQCGAMTFGHLGFTGTSLWIDIEKKKGVVFLTNATQKFWYDRVELNNFRREIANAIWMR